MASSMVDIMLITFQWTLRAPLMFDRNFILLVHLTFPYSHASSFSV